MDYTRLFDILPYQQKRFPQKTALAFRKNSQWLSWSTEQAIKERDQLSAGLLELGYLPGDRIGILANGGSPYWNIADAGMMQIGIIPVPIHATARLDEIRHIAKDAEMKACFVGSPELLDKLRASKIDLKHVFSFENLENTFTWDKLLCEPDEKEHLKIQYYRDGISDQHLATILYTSGTTGVPKGVMLSHANIISNIKAVVAIAPIDYQTVALSFLPMSHILERMVTFGYMAVGAQIWYADAVENLPLVFQEVRPHFFTAVPRIIERMYERLLERRDKQGILGKKIFDWAMALGERYPFAGAHGMPFDYRLKLLLARALVFRSIKKALGGRVQGIAVGAAALQPRLGCLLSAVGVEVREGYGLTETSPVVSFNRFEPGGVHFGTVGIPVPGVEVRIAADETQESQQNEGEIQVRGPNVMMGYLNLPEETAEKFTPDGWLKTGDVGHFEFKRFLKITGRKSEIFKTNTGKFVAPQFVEQQLLTSPFIAQCMALGLNKSHVGVLIVPNFMHLENWCVENKVHWTSPQFMILNPKIEKLYKAIIAEINGQKLGNEEKVKTLRLIHEPWTTENGLLTPTLKMRRDRIEKEYEKLVEELF